MTPTPRRNSDPPAYHHHTPSPAPPLDRGQSPMVTDPPPTATVTQPATATEGTHATEPPVSGFFSGASWAYDPRTHMVRHRPCDCDTLYGQHYDAAFTADRDDLMRALDAAKAYEEVRLREAELANERWQAETERLRRERNESCNEVRELRRQLDEHPAAPQEPRPPVAPAVSTTPVSHPTPAIVPISAPPPAPSSAQSQLTVPISAPPPVPSFALSQLTAAPSPSIPVGQKRARSEHAYDDDDDYSDDEDEEDIQEREKKAVNREYTLKLRREKKVREREKKANARAPPASSPSSSSQPASTTGSWGQPGQSPWGRSAVSQSSSTPDSWGPSQSWGSSWSSAGAGIGVTLPVPPAERPYDPFTGILVSQGQGHARAQVDEQFNRGVADDDAAETIRDWLRVINNASPANRTPLALYVLQQYSQRHYFLRPPRVLTATQHNLARFGPQPAPRGRGAPNRPALVPRTMHAGPPTRGTAMGWSSANATVPRTTSTNAPPSNNAQWPARTNAPNATVPGTERMGQPPARGGAPATSGQRSGAPTQTTQLNADVEMSDKKKKRKKKKVHRTNNADNAVPLDGFASVHDLVPDDLGASIYPPLVPQRVGPPHLEEPAAQWLEFWRAHPSQTPSGVEPHDQPALFYVQAFLDYRRLAPAGNSEDQCGARLQFMHAMTQMLSIPHLTEHLIHDLGSAIEFSGPGGNGIAFTGDTHNLTFEDLTAHIANAGYTVQQIRAMERFARAKRNRASERDPQDESEWAEYPTVGEMLALHGTLFQFPSPARATPSSRVSLDTAPLPAGGTAPVGTATTSSSADPSTSNPAPMDVVVDDTPEGAESAPASVEHTTGMMPASTSNVENIAVDAVQPDSPSPMGEPKGDVGPITSWRIAIDPQGEGVVYSDRSSYLDDLHVRNRGFQVTFGAGLR
ncbi:hypothetical protein FA95DRAFT_1573233 [Auriscalpium vulgare]|uniref:Uncharacterized protein n=1 Tax=Auriscalpium vulgare TaxID=40419 RepID=A0ACB8RQA3_9AGAM|nr:hypothetical protein FA95DRAFT_1573233 [Auriscalpium vulgare]